MLCRQEGTAALRRFHNHHPAAQAADDPVPPGEMPAQGRRPRSVLRKDAAQTLRLLKKGLVLPRVDHIRAAAQHAHRGKTRGKSRLHSCAVDAFCQTGNHQPSRRRDLSAETLRRLPPIDRRMAGTHHAYRGQLVKVGKGSSVIEHNGRIINCFQSPGIQGAVVGQDLQTGFGAVG